MSLLSQVLSPLFLLIVLFPMGVIGESALFSDQGYRISHYRSPLPSTPPHGELLDTQQLSKLIQSSDPLLIDLLAITLRPETAQFGLSWLPASPRKHIPGSIWLPNVGYGHLEPCMQAWFERSLHRLTGGDLARPMVFYCVTDCWMSWNAVKRASELGYRNLYWYPEGSDGWAEAGLPLVSGEPEPLPGMGGGLADTLFECPAVDLSRALEKGNDSERDGVLLFFETGQCPFCRRMRAGVLADKGLITEYRKKYIAVALDMESEQPMTDLDGSLTSAKALAHSLGVARTPTMVFLDGRGEERYRHSGLIADPRRFLALLNYVSGNHQDSLSFKEYFSSTKD
ncbi:MAG: thioredoxin fold domain-containing protein [Candidatus Thiodiazotropha sp. 6PLUC2]